MTRRGSPEGYCGADTPDAQYHQEIPVLSLPEPAWRIGWGRDVRSRWRRARICGNLGRRRLRQSYTRVHFQVFLRAVRAKSFAGVFVAEAGQFVAAVDTVAISCE
jgi:hypothetical protein